MASSSRRTIELLIRKAEAVEQLGVQFKKVIGPPGTGKTTEAIARYKDAMEAGMFPLMISFSRAARENMQSRAKEDLGLDEDEVYKSFRTLDSVCLHRQKAILDKLDGIETQEAGQDATPAGKQLVWELFDVDKRAFLSKLERDRIEFRESSDQSAINLTSDKFQSWLLEEPETERLMSQIGVSRLGELFSFEDNPIRPGSVWTMWERKMSNLGFEETEDEDQTYKQIWEPLWELWLKFCWEHRVLFFRDIRLLNATRYDLSNSWWSTTRSLIVDEAQDLNAMQFYIILRWCESINIEELHIVGDPNQSIMEFQGASASFLLDVFQPISDRQGNSKFLETTYRFGSKICDVSERYRKEVLSRHWKQAEGTVRSHREGGHVEKMPGATPEEILKIIKDNAEVGEVFVLFTNRYGGGWKQLETLMCEDGIPYKTATGDPSYDNWQGIAGCKWRDPEIDKKMQKMLDRGSSANPEWVFKRPINAVAALLETPPDSSPGKLYDRQLKGLDVLTRVLLAEDWEEKLKKTRRRMKVTGSSRAELTPDDIQDWWRHERHAHLGAKLVEAGSSVAELLRVVEQYAEPVYTGLFKGGKEQIYLKMWDCYRRYHANWLENPKVSIATVHQVKGKECDTAIFIPTGPPYQFFRKWEIPMLKVYYVALTRARDSLYICPPDMGGPIWENTVESQPWRGLENVFANTHADDYTGYSLIEDSDDG